MAGGIQAVNSGEPVGPPQLHNRMNRRKSHGRVGYDEENDPIPDEHEEGPPVRVRHVLEGLFHTYGHASNSEQVDIEHYIHDKSFRRRLILLSLSNSKIGIRVHFLRTIIFVIGCLLYVAEATYYDYWGERIDLSGLNSTLEEEVARLYRFFVFSDKPWILWALEVVVGLVCLGSFSFTIYARINEWSLRGLVKVLTHSLIIQFVVGFLYVITLLYPPFLRNLFVPLFLLCWSARQDLESAVIQSASRKFGFTPKTFTLKAISLAVFLACFMFTWVCVLHHVELDSQNLRLFDALWFVLVSVSTVGYGDISPVHFSGKLFVMLFIVLGFVFILPQVEELYNAFQMQRRMHNSVSYTDSRKHVILCSTELRPMIIRDFLTEFFSDPKNIDVHCVLMAEKELSPLFLVYLSHPIWSTRITVLIGSPLRWTDLARARADTAIACFLHTPRNSVDPEAADQHTVLSAWSFKNFAPNCTLFVHILRPESRVHLDMADHVLCEGELKQALMGNHMHCPGVSTLVTLLLHTFKSEQRALTSTDFRLYHMCSSCEVYDSRVGDSKYFHYFVGKNFLFAAVVAYRKYQVTLLGVRPKNSSHTLLNPGLHYILDEDDICYYIGFTREEYSKVRENPPSAARAALWQACASVALLSLGMAGFNPDKLGGEVQSGCHDGLHSRRSSCHSMAPVHSWKSGGGGKEEEVKAGTDSPLSQRHAQFYIPEEEEEGDKAAAAQAQAARTEMKRGLKLLRYHSKIDVFDNPVVKVCVTPVCTSPEKEKAREEGKVNEEFELEWVVPKDPKSMEAGGVEASPTRRRWLRRSLSDHECLAMPEESTMIKERGIMYSSQLSLVNPPTNTSLSTTHTLGPSHTHLVLNPLSQAFRRMSSWTTHRQPSSLTTFGEHSETSEVVLELEDISEQKELEELEDGQCGGDEEEEESEEEEPPSPPHTPTAKREPEKLTRTNSKPRYVKGPLPFLPYCGCDSDRFHLLPERRPHHCIRLDQQGSSEPDSGSGDPGKGGVADQWQVGAVIVYCEEASKELYHLLLPLRAHYLHTASLKPVVLLLEKEPSPGFLDLISQLPMVHYLTGHISDVDSWLRAGILVSETVMITGGARSQEEQEHMVDSTHILAAQKLARVFPHVNIMIELQYRYNMRFLQFTTHDAYIMRDTSSVRGDQLTYLFMPQFAAGKAFCTSMLDTMLYQSHFKPYIIDLVRQLLGCEQANDSAYLWKMEVTEELLKLQTYDRLLQRVATTHHILPLGIYRTIPISSCPELEKLSSERAAKDEKKHSCYVHSRLEMMSGKLDSHTLGLVEREPPEQTQSFVLVNPPPKTHLQKGDILLTLKPHHPPSHPHPSNPLISDALEKDRDSGVHPISPSQSSPHLPPVLRITHHPPSPSPPAHTEITVTAECHQ